MNIAMISSEVLPFSKTGGLSDVSYSLSKEYVKLGHRVSIITPFYRDSDKKISKKLKKVMQIQVIMNWRKPLGNVFHVEYDGIDYYLIQNQQYFERGGLYGYYDDGERFAYFSLASLEVIKKLPYRIDVIHVHDWQSAMIPCLIKEKYFDDEVLANIKTCLTIHNPMFKGYLAKDSLFDLYNLGVHLFDEGKVRLDDQVSTLKAGITFSDKITTVSPTHAEELKTVEGSKGLWYDLNLRNDDFIGITNGMDYKEFNPSKDKFIYNNYGIKNVHSEKYINKINFAKKHDLNPDLPLYAVVSRLTSQKGLELIKAMADFLVSQGGNFALVGSGESDAENYFRELEGRYPHNVYCYIGYNNELAHELYASSDFFIMPSAFEPCGIGQMIAMRYGSLPIVRRTGGLKDTVIPLNEDDSNYKEATGIGFDNYDVLSAIKVVSKSLILYNGKKDIMKKVIVNALRSDHSWKKPAMKYIELYNSIKK